MSKIFGETKFWISLVATRLYLVRTERNDFGENNIENIEIVPNTPSS